MLDENIEESGNADLATKSAFLESLDWPQEQRADFVRQRWSSNKRLVNEVCQLLSTYENSLNESILDLDFGNLLLNEISDSSDSGAALHYEIDAAIGGGACAVVYAASQTKPLHRKVAIKMLRPEFAENAELQSRFRFEQKTQSKMDHPNVVQFFDAGESAEGLPFLVMELLEGKSIIRFANDNNLNVRERLEVFLDVCEGVQHAHQRGIIHRDLKPSNVLVTCSDGKTVAKVIDFGICKAAVDFEFSHCRITQAGQYVGSLAYMSPEQLSSSDDVDTRSDIFSLGTLLYEILTGRSPFFGNDLPSPQALRESICHAEPEKLGLPDCRVRGWTVPLGATTENVGMAATPKNELDWIIAKALQKKPDRRYATVGEFSTDIRRYLRHEPLSASPPSNMYLFSKFVRRNRGLAFSVVALIACLCCGLIGTTVGMRTAIEQRTIAEIEKEEAINRASLSDKAVKIIDEMFDENLQTEQHHSSQFALQDWFNDTIKVKRRDLMRAEVKEANLRLQTGVFLAKLDYYSEAETQLRRAFELYSEVLDEKDEVMLNSTQDLATVLWRQGKQREAARLNTIVYNIRKTFLSFDDIDMMCAAECVARSLDFEAARALYRRVLLQLENYIGGPNHHRAIAIQHNFAVMLMKNGCLSEAVREFEAILNSEMQHNGDCNPRVLRARHNLIPALRMNDQLDEAVAVLEKGCELDALHCKPHFNRLLWLAELKYQNQNFDAALQEARETLKRIPREDSVGIRKANSLIAKCQPHCQTKQVRN